MKAASVCTVLGLTLISGALLAATTGMTNEMPSRLEARFEALDDDGDGRVARSELDADAALRQHFGALDGNGDGVLSWPEFRGQGMPDWTNETRDATS
jgi:Ca2+-binding EF-hand superfamily protein